MEQNSSRDSFQGWGRTKESIAKTVKVIEFLSARYGNRSKLYAIDLLDKPAAPGVSLESLKQYYKEGYEAVRRYTSKAYVIMSNRLNANSKELLKFASGLPRSVLNIHYYDMFSGTENRSLEAELSALTSVQNGPLIFIGDWTVNWSSTAKSERIPIDSDDYKRHTLSKLQVLNRASFGWAYWALRIENKEDELAAEEKEDWSLETIVGKDYIKLNN